MTSEIVVSAAKGSVDVLHMGAQPVVVGDIAGINAGVEVSPGVQQCWLGSAIVRSTLSSQITVRDFPAALSGGEKVRFGTTEPLPAGHRTPQVVENLARTPRFYELIFLTEIQEKGFPFLIMYSLVKLGLVTRF